MKRLIALLLLVLVLFYVAWPAWSLHQVSTAIRDQDEGLLARKIDFPRVRQSLRPVLTGEAAKSLERLQGKGGAIGSLLASQLKGDMMKPLVEAALDLVITPANVLHIARERRALKEALQHAMADQLPGVIGGNRKKDQPQPGATTDPSPETGAAAFPDKPARDRGLWPRYSISNIKSIAMRGPLQLEFGVSRNPDANAAEVLAKMEFTGTDWKIVSLEPRF